MYHTAVRRLFHSPRREVEATVLQKPLSTTGLSLSTSRNAYLIHVSGVPAYSLACYHQLLQ